MSSSKNLGQVAGLFIGTSAPSNTTIIWYDSTTNQQCHKVYDAAKGTWVTLNPQIVANTTYSELVNNAKKNGLSIGKFYQVTDKSNVLAIALSTTKVQYVDTLGNILVDDLGSNIQYHVSSDNLLIDDINGVFDTSTNKLLFNFTESDPKITDYIFGKRNVNSVWKLIRFSVKTLISSVSGNSLSWNGGIYFNFSTALKALIDKDGGVVSKSTYEQNLKVLTNSINAISKENQTIITNVNTAITENTTDGAIYDKKNPKNIDTAIAPGDVLKGDTLFTIVSKFQRWINKFKYATGIQLSRSFADASSQQYVNNNDTVESALGKVQYMLKHPTTAYALPETWTYQAPTDENGDEILEENGGWLAGTLPKAGDDFSTAFAKLANWCAYVYDYIALRSTWTPKEYTQIFDLPVGGDLFQEAFAKIVGKLNQIGTITNGVIKSKATAYQDSTNSVTTINLSTGSITLNPTSSNSDNGTVVVSNKGINAVNSNNNCDIEIGLKNFLISTSYGSQYSVDGFSSPTDARGSKIFVGACFLNKNYTALTAKTSGNYKYGYYDAFFGNMKIGALVLDAKFVSANVYITADTSMVICNNTTAAINVYLPSNPETGRVVYVLRGANKGVNVYAQGGNGIDEIDSAKDYTDIDSRGQMYMFVFNDNVYYENDTSHMGLWSWTKMGH